MKKGYSVENEKIFNESNCIVVQNLKAINVVCNHPLLFNELDDIIGLETCVGVWKIKNKN